MIGHIVDIQFVLKVKFPISHKYSFDKHPWKSEGYFRTILKLNQIFPFTPAFSCVKPSYAYFRLNLSSYSVSSTFQ